MFLKHKKIKEREVEDKIILEILPNAELYYYINSFLINNKNFIKDVDSCLCDGNMKKMNIDERKEYFKYAIANGARSYILKLLTLKHLLKILLENVDGFVDMFWVRKLKLIDFVFDEGDKYGN